MSEDLEHWPPDTSSSWVQAVDVVMVVEEEPDDSHDLEKEFKEAEILVDVVDANCLVLVTGGRKFKILTVFLSVDVFVLEKLAQLFFLADNFGRILLSVGFRFTIGGQKDSLLWNFGTLDPSGVKEITSDFLEDMLEDVSTDLRFIFFGLEKANGT